MINNYIEPADIEKRSFEIIDDYLGDRKIEADFLPVLKRVIHATADFDYVDILKYSENAIDEIKKILKNGCTIITDTEMARSGINKRVLEKHGIKTECYVNDDDVRAAALEQKTTRSYIAVQKAFNSNKGDLIFVVGNAPTALLSIYESKLKPAFIVAVPVGFVNVTETKELVKNKSVPYIVSEGNKGGSTVAVAIINAVIYELFGRG